MQLGRERAAARGQARHGGSTDERWDGRPLAALAVRVAIVVVPLIASVLVAAGVSSALPPPTGAAARILRVAIVLACSTAALVGADRCTRRLMPLAALLQMSMLFPGRAPTRFAVARQAGSPRRLVEMAARAKANGSSDGPAVAAQRTLVLVTALSAHDRHTRGHVERVRVFTDLIADELRLPEQDRDRLRWAALLHDIGKMSVPASLLNKPGKPTASEWELLRRHPEEGARLAAPLLLWLGEWGSVILQHHERYDGTGYPAGLAGVSICRGARIVAVADSFEVMTAPRSYKRSMSRALALAELTRCAGSQFDPAVVRAFLSISTPRLRWAMGPLSWLAQLPILGSVPSTAGLASQAATGMGVLALGGAVGFGPLAVMDATAAADPRRPASGAPTASDSATEYAGGGEHGRPDRARGRGLIDEPGGRPGDRPGGPAPAAHGRGADGAQGPGGPKDGGRPSPKPPEATSIVTSGKTVAGPTATTKQGSPGSTK